jgi:hypothetical protein
LTIVEFTEAVRLAPQLAKGRASAVPLNRTWTRNSMIAQRNRHAGRNGHAEQNGEQAVIGPADMGLAPLKPSATEASPSPAAGGRDACGRFTAGNRYGKGNPHARRMAALRQAFLDAATEDRMRKLAEKLYAAAVAGDWQAAGLFLRYVIGRPGDAVDPDRVDLDEWQLRRDGPDFADVLAAVSKLVARDALGILQKMKELQAPVRILPPEGLP